MIKQAVEEAIAQSGDGLWSTRRNPSRSSFAVMTGVVRSCLMMPVVGRRLDELADGKGLEAVIFC